MTPSMRIVILIIGTFLFITILELVRRRKFREELSIVWLLIGFGLILASFADLIVDPLAFKLGISYPPALVFMLIFFLFVLVILYFSIVVSDLKGKNKELSQKIALMEYKLGKLYKED
ncbi:MAG: hypothetical protein OHK0032_11890 [Thermodesulfovibrionales bacterium]